MTNTLLNDGTVMYYVLKVNGKTVSPPVADRYALEQYRVALPADQQVLAEVVTVTQQGQELLLG